MPFHSKQSTLKKYTHTHTNPKAITMHGMNIWRKGESALSPSPNPWLGIKLALKWCVCMYEWMNESFSLLKKRSVQRSYTVSLNFVLSSPPPLCYVHMRRAVTQHFFDLHSHCKAVALTTVWIRGWESRVEGGREGGEVKQEKKALNKNAWSSSVW